MSVAPTKALLVYISKQNKIADDYHEFKQLATSSDIDIIDTVTVLKHQPTANYLIGSGKVTELADLVSQHGIDVIVFNQRLTPSQERNLSKVCQCRILDRTGLILDIFALRAHSFEGKLQVELAQLKHLSTRLVRGWTHLERQKGGIGLRGPGETQLETDRRLLNRRVRFIEKRLVKVDKTRALARQLRLKKRIPIIALVGYTNVGKSTLFNVLTNANDYADDRLFATLDAHLKRVMLPALGEAIIIDTVGFIENLPPALIAAFKSTLAETISGDLLLHVSAANDVLCQDKISYVEDLLGEIGAEHIPSIVVMNKIDALAQTMQPRVDYDEKKQVSRVWLSAQNKTGIKLLLDAISQSLAGQFCTAMIEIPLSLSAIRHKIYQMGYVQDEKMDEFGRWRLEIKVTRHYLEKLQRTKGLIVKPIADL